MINKTAKFSGDGARQILIFKGLATTLLLVNFALLIWFLFEGYKALFHSDSAAKVLLAQEIFKSESLFPPNWNFVNGDLFVLFGHILIVPLLFVMKPGFAVHAISGLLMSVIMLTGIYLLLGYFKVKGIHRLLILSALCAGFSGFLAENLYGQVSYGVTISINAFLTLLEIKLLFDKSERSKFFKLSIAYFVLAFLIVVSNPIRAGVTYFAPLFLTLTIYGFVISKRQWHSEKIYRIFFLALFSVAAILFGFVTHYYILDHVNNVRGAGTAFWLTYEQSMSNLLLVGKGLLAILGSAPAAGGKLTSFIGLFEAVRLLLAIVTLVLIPYSVIYFLKNGTDTVRFFTIYVLISFAIVMFVQVFTTVPVMSDPIISSRYLVPSVVYLVIIAFMRPKFDFENRTLTIFTCLLIFFYSLMAYPVFAASYINSTIYLDGANERARRADMVEFLKENNLSYGYASYWNAGIYTVLSDGNVAIRQILIDRGIPMPMRHLSSDTWYMASQWSGRTFLMLTPEERGAVDWETLQANGLKVIEELHKNGLDIFIFEKNLAEKLPGWDLSYRKNTIFKTSPNSLRNFGLFYKDDNSKDDGYLLAKEADKGALHFGPYIRISPGKYVVKFDVDKFHYQRDVLKIDVATSPEQKILAERYLNSTNGQGESLVVELSKMETLEFRVWALGGGNIKFRSVSIQRSPD